MGVAIPILALLAAFQSHDSSAQQIEREDFLVESEPGISLFVREVRLDHSRGDDRTPILLLHGARVPGLVSFDLQVLNGSLAADLAKSGHPVYIMDARGYGRSTRPPEIGRRSSGTWCTQRK